MKYLPLVGAVALAACSNTSAIEDAVRENLVDPDSAKFGKVVEFTKKGGGQMACVMVNAKNRMGGYTGEEAFLLMRDEEGNWTSLGSGGELLNCAHWVIEFKGDNE